MRLTTEHANRLSAALDTIEQGTAELPGLVDDGGDGEAFVQRAEAAAQAFADAISAVRGSQNEEGA